MALGGRICNLCLVKCEKFKSIDGDIRTSLDILVPTTIEFTTIQDPVICKNCEEILRKCFDFKTICLHSYDYLVPLVNSKDVVKLDLKDVYPNKKVKKTGISEDQNVCGFCMDLVENRYSVSLDVDVIKEADVTLEKMMEQCLPELDVSIIKNPIICEGCHRSLEKCFRFVTNCLTVEEKIKKHCETLDVNSRSHIELSSLLHSIMRTSEVSDMVGDIVDLIQPEKKFRVKFEIPEESEIGSAGGVIKLEQISCDDSEYVHEIGNKSESFIPSDKQEVSKGQPSTSKNISTSVEKYNTFGTVKTEETFCGENETKPKNEDSVEMDDQKFLIHEEIEIKTDAHDFNRFEESTVMIQTPFNTRLGGRRKRLMSHFEDHLLKPHIKQTKDKDCLKRHVLKHMESSNATMLKCDLCPYQTKWKNGIRMHVLKHIDPSKVTMFNCQFCSYRTKYKEHLKQHSIIHKPDAERTMFKCELCSYQAKMEYSLKYHMLEHMDPSDVKMFICGDCSYQTKNKKYLKIHSVIHKASSEITMFKCESCPYQAKWKSSLKSHMLKHRDDSKVIMLNCQFCSYRTKYKVNLKTHSVIHKASSERTMFKCESCPYQAKWKSSLASHMLKHMDPSDVKVFICDDCSYQTVHKRDLKRHSVIHKPAGEITMFKCNSCPYQITQKHRLRMHLLKYRDPSKVLM